MIMWYNSLKLQKSDHLIQSHCKTLLIGFVKMSSWTQNILQFGWSTDRRLQKWNYNEFLAMSLLEILCSSRSSCSSCVLRLRRFLVEVLRGFRGLNPQSFTDLWFVDISGGFWAWFQQTLGSRQIVWMILLRVFFNFGVEVLEGFEAWFL